MTIYETSFFRDVRPFEMLRSKAIPELIAQRSGERRLRIWSAACSTGQEAYSIAMLLLEDFPELQDWDVKVIGTDTSQEVLDYAIRGRFRRMEVNRGLPVRMLLKYFERRGEQWEISERVRTLCEFWCADLRESQTILPDFPHFDVILLRNVLLYLSEEDRSRAFEMVYRLLNAKGFLLLGNSEQAEDSSERFQAEVAADCYFYKPKALCC